MRAGGGVLLILRTAFGFVLPGAAHWFSSSGWGSRTGMRVAIVLREIEKRLWVPTSKRFAVAFLGSLQ